MKTILVLVRMACMGYTNQSFIQLLHKLEFLNCKYTTKQLYFSKTLSSTVSAHLIACGLE